MGKPKIRYIGRYLWQCFSDMTTAVGRTPDEAYAGWSVAELGRQVRNVRSAALPQLKRS